MKTPQKTFQMPLRPINGQTKTPAALKSVFTNGSNEQLSAIKKPIHSNTFCTPNKIRKLEGKPLNQTDIGLTPKEKLKFGSIHSNFNPLQIGLPLNNQMMRNHNESIDSRSSIMSMNVSTSTLLDAPAITNTNTYSPIVRRYEILETKIEKLMDYMKEVHSHNKENTEKPVEESKLTNHEATLNNRFSLSSIRSELQNIAREEILTFTQNIYNKTHAPTEQHAIINEIPHETQPFAQSSPISNTAELRKRLPFDDTEKSFDDTVKPYKTTIDQTNHTVFFQSTRVDDYTQTNETVIPAKRRTSRRYSHQTVAEKSFRRSTRIEYRMSLRTIPDDDDLDNNPVPRKLSLTRNLPKERRESIRRSMRIQQRQSVMPIEEEYDSKKMPRKAVGKVVPINNKTIAEYFNVKCDNVQPKTKAQAKSAQQKHEKAVLDLLNSGSIREIQILPQVGLKTAYQIVTHRTLNGKFKNFNQVSKLPWRGKAWERFKLANNISDNSVA